MHVRGTNWAFEVIILAFRSLFDSSLSGFYSDFAQMSPIYGHSSSIYGLHIRILTAFRPHFIRIFSAFRPEFDPIRVLFSQH